MKKFLVTVLILLVAVVVALGVYLNSIIKGGVETVGSLVTGVPVTLKDVDISLMSGKGRLKELSVGNPVGFKTKDAFSLKEVKLTLDVRSVFSEKIIIHEVLINAPDITYEKSGRSDNIQIILNNIEKIAGGIQKIIPEKGKSKKKASRAEQKVQIDNFTLKNGKVNMSATVFQGGKLTFPLKDVHIRDIGKEKGGATLSQALHQILAAINENTVTAAAGSVAGVKKTAGRTVGGAVGALKGLFGK